MAQIRNLSQTLSASKALSRGLKLHLWQLQFQHLQETEVKTLSQNITGNKESKKRLTFLDWIRKLRLRLFFVYRPFLFGYRKYICDQFRRHVVVISFEAKSAGRGPSIRTSALIGQTGTQTRATKRRETRNMDSVTRDQGSRISVFNPSSVRTLTNLEVMRGF